MAAFQATFSSGTPAVPQVYGENGTVFVSDESNYDGGTTAGHTLNDFSKYRRCTLLLPDGTYAVKSSVGEVGVEVIGAAKDAVDHDLDFNISDYGDWEYTVKLYTVPTFDIAITYATNACVYVEADDMLYKALRETLGDAPLTSTDDWSPLTTDGVIDPDLLSDAYIASLQWAVMYDTEVGWMRMVNLANRDTTGRDIKKLTDNLYYMTSLKLNLILDAVVGLVEVNDFEGVRYCVSEAKEILSHVNNS
jgi:hypothetical protein